MRFFKNFPVYCLLMVLVVLLTNKAAHAQADKLEGVWYNDIKTAKILITKGNNGKFNGKIVWLKVVNDENGKPRTDIKNPDAKLKHRPLMGLHLLANFIKDPDDEDRYIDGTIYDPLNGKVYMCKIKYEGKTIRIRGYVMIPLFGRTTHWERTN
ncbi:DUF2147 domain-containing protein [Mucilaginibacter polytrichastri]|uniref:DUF2147 domain-containing protein n=1 Tax=Mucilaginibacter polytrichastri TaxID=1302689 RepID=A0A1Q5ZYK3_9SPHI|nr:DUF2147 domain-containing protein [Mucilaginibacter polytrichastri]OKS86827.1 hypothetical protein RG47T_2284 [Mucilaginibacter polytrichastri]SFT17254.1 Uncharacterized conserved protein, DUF2147 family [Mucilaginibacter polytrichastri]